MYKNNFDDEIIKIDKNTPSYPSFLYEIEKPPQTLYALGNINLLKEDIVAIVGTRKASENGRNIAFSLAQNLCNNGLVIVSGLASRHRFMCS